MRVLWISPRYPRKEQIQELKRLLRTKWIDITWVERLEDVDLQEFDVIAGHTGVKEVARIVKEKGIFYNSVQIKYSSKKYRFLGFSKIYKFRIEKMKSLKNGRILSITRHYFTKDGMEKLKEMNNGEVPYIRRIDKFITSWEVVVELMKKYNCGDVQWITNLYYLEGLVNAGIHPFRFEDREFWRIAEFAQGASF